MNYRNILAFALLALAAQANGNVNRLTNIPLIFEKNTGQTDGCVDFLSRGQGYTLFLTKGDAVLRLESSVVRMRLLGRNDAARGAGADALPGRSNYFFGGEPKNWHTDVPQYARVRYSSVYPGIDLVYYGKQKQLEYDFIVNPGADPSAIRLQFDGAKEIKLEASGDLLVDVLRFQRPVVYQTVNGAHAAVPGAFRTTEDYVAFDIGEYRKDLPLVIDPVLSYSTYLGGRQDDAAVGIAVDAAGNAYVAGSTASGNFPTTTGALDTTRNNEYDIFVSKLNPTGTALIYSTFLSGTDISVADIAIDSAGNAYITGRGKATSTPGAYQSCGECTYVAKLNGAGSRLEYLTGIGFQAHWPRLAVAADGDASRCHRVRGDHHIGRLSANERGGRGHGRFTAEPQWNRSSVCDISRRSRGRAEPGYRDRR